MDGRRRFLKALAFGGLTCFASHPEQNPESAKLCMNAPGVPWVRRRIREDAPETFQRFLRRSPETGTTVIVFFPAGWRTEQLVYYESDEAILVLEGDFTIGGHTLGPGGFCYLPHRMIRKHISSEKGAVVLAFFSRISRHFSADPAQSAEANHGLEIVNPWSLSWEMLHLPTNRGVSGALLMKSLQDAAGAASRTGLVGLAPGFAIPGVASSNGWQEWFLLSGHLLVGKERCGPGAYGFLPAGTSAGPICTETGAFLVSRGAASARIEITPSPHGKTLVERYLAAARYAERPGRK